MLKCIILIFASIGLFIYLALIILLVMAECHLDTVVRKEMKKYKRL